MTHDPLCPCVFRTDPHYDTLGRCNCAFIARVRADERERAAERVRGLADAWAPGDEERYWSPVWCVNEVLAAVRGDSC